MGNWGQVAKRAAESQPVLRVDALRIDDGEDETKRGECVVFFVYGDGAPLADDLAYECTFTVTREATNPIGRDASVVRHENLLGEMGLRVVQLWTPGVPAVAHCTAPEVYAELESLLTARAQKVCDAWNADEQTTRRATTSPRALTTADALKAEDAAILLRKNTANLSLVFGGDTDALLSDAPRANAWTCKRCGTKRAFADNKCPKCGGKDLAVSAPMEAA